MTTNLVLLYSLVFAVKQVKVAGRLLAGTHRAEVRVEAAADIADGLHQLCHNFF